MKLVKRGAVLLLAVLLLTGASCDKSLRQAAVLLRDFAVVLEQVQNGFEAAHQAGFVSDEGYQQVQGGIGEIAVAGQEAVAMVREGKKGAAVAAIDRGLVAVDRLLHEGVLHIKNEDRRVAVQAIILNLRGLLATARAILEA